MYEKFLFSDENKFVEIEQQLTNKAQLERFLYDTFYSDLLYIGDDLFMKTKVNKLTKDDKKLSLQRAIKYYSHKTIEEYEKCAHLQSLLNKFKN